MLDITPIILNVNKRYQGDLVHYFNHVCEAPNFHMPYHNFRHLCHVLWEVYDAAMQMGLDPVETRILLIAALMHDYDHTGMKGEDAINIERAIRALDQIALEEDRKYLIEIRAMVRATQYPYTDEVFTPNQLLLRDADQSQTFSLVWMQSLGGLGQEMGISFRKILEMQRPFMENIKFHTLWGQNKFVPMIPMHLSRVDGILDILKRKKNKENNAL